VLGADGPAADRCSRAGCHNLAAMKVNWRNPRIHPENRVKVWLACDEHSQYLGNYLASRSFPVIVTQLSENVSVVPS
jgi:hypothetical protein